MVTNLHPSASDDHIKEAYKQAEDSFMNAVSEATVQHLARLAEDSRRNLQTEPSITPLELGTVLQLAHDLLRCNFHKKRSVNDRNTHLGGSYGLHSCSLTTRRNPSPGWTFLTHQYVERHTSGWYTTALTASENNRATRARRVEGATP